jgi:uncharacterized protein (TIGR02246 family)
VLVTTEQGVLDTEAAYDAAWCAGDLDRLMECLATDAVLVNPRGEVATGASEIRMALGGFLAGEAAGTHHHSRIERISFVTPDVAVVDGRASVSSGGDAQVSPSFEHAFTDVLRRSGSGQWLITHVRAYGLTSVP